MIFEYRFPSKKFFRRSPVRRSSAAPVVGSFSLSAPFPDCPRHTSDEASADRGVNISDARGIDFGNPTLSSQLPPLITITDVVNSSLDSLTFPGEVRQLLRVEGTTSRMITIRGTNIQNPEKVVSLGPSVSQQAVLIEE